MFIGFILVKKYSYYIRKYELLSLNLEKLLEIVVNIFFLIFEYV